MADQNPFGNTTVGPVGVYNTNYGSKAQGYAQLAQGINSAAQSLANIASINHQQVIQKNQIEGAQAGQQAGNVLDEKGNPVPPSFDGLAPQSAYGMAFIDAAEQSYLANIRQSGKNKASELQARFPDNTMGFDQAFSEYTDQVMGAVPEGYVNVAGADLDLIGRAYRSEVLGKEIARRNTETIERIGKQAGDDFELALSLARQGDDGGSMDAYNNARQLYETLTKQGLITDTKRDEIFDDMRLGLSVERISRGVLPIFEGKGSDPEKSIRAMAIANDLFSVSPDEMGLNNTVERDKVAQAVSARVRQESDRRMQVWNQKQAWKTYNQSQAAVYWTAQGRLGNLPSQVELDSMMRSEKINIGTYQYLAGLMDDRVQTSLNGAIGDFTYDLEMGNKTLLQGMQDQLWGELPVKTRVDLQEKLVGAIITGQREVDKFEALALLDMHMIPPTGLEEFLGVLQKNGVLSSSETSTRRRMYWEYFNGPATKQILAQQAANKLSQGIQPTDDNERAAFNELYHYDLYDQQSRDNAAALAKNQHFIPEKVTDALKNAYKSGDKAAIQLGVDQFSAIFDRMDNTFADNTAGALLDQMGPEAYWFFEGLSAKLDIKRDSPERQAQVIEDELNATHARMDDNSSYKRNLAKLFPDSEDLNGELYQRVPQIVADAAGEASGFFQGITDAVAPWWRWAYQADPELKAQIDEMARLGKSKSGEAPDFSRIFGEMPNYVRASIVENLKDQIATARGSLTIDQFPTMTVKAMKNFLENNTVYISTQKGMNYTDVSSWNDIDRLQFIPGKSVARKAANTAPPGIEMRNDYFEDAVRIRAVAQGLPPPSDAFYAPGLGQDERGWNDVNIVLMQDRRDKNKYGIYYQSVGEGLVPYLAPDKSGKIVNPTVTADFAMTPQGQRYYASIQNLSTHNSIVEKALQVPLLGKWLLNNMQQFDIDQYTATNQDYLTAYQALIEQGVEDSVARSMAIESVKEWPE